MTRSRIQDFDVSIRQGTDCVLAENRHHVIVSTIEDITLLCRNLTSVPVTAKLYANGVELLTKRIGGNDKMAVAMSGISGYARAALELSDGDAPWILDAQLVGKPAHPQWVFLVEFSGPAGEVHESQRLSLGFMPPEYDESYIAAVAG